MSEDKGSLENLRLEYSEANNNRRHYSNLRFAVLTVFFAVLGGVASVAFGFVEIKSPSSLNIARWRESQASYSPQSFFTSRFCVNSTFVISDALLKTLKNRLAIINSETESSGKFPKPRISCGVCIR